MSAEFVTVKLVKSYIGRPEKHRKTLEALGLTRLNQERKIPSTPPMLGMVEQVRHLVRVVG